MMGNRMVAGRLCASQTLIRVSHRRQDTDIFSGQVAIRLRFTTRRFKLQRQCEGGSIGRFKGHQTIQRMASLVSSNPRTLSCRQSGQ